jgi:transcription antitermination factor NusG
MYSTDQTWNSHELSGFAAPPIEADAEQWFAVHTHARHEKVAEQELRLSGITTFLPLVKEVRNWSDRRKVIELPLFSCYLFVKLVPRNDERVRVLRVNGVLKFVGPNGIGIPIPDEQIHAVKTLVEEQLPLCSHPFLKIGQRVRVRGGALTGVEGILVSRGRDCTLVISLDAIQRSLSVRIQGYDVEPV